MVHVKSASFYVGSSAVSVTLLRQKVNLEDVKGDINNYYINN